MASDNARLDCRELRKSFGGVTALDDFTLEFPGSGVVALVGPNGAGKTTLLNVLTGILRPDSGRWYFDLDDMTDLPPHRIAARGITRSFQELRMAFGISALENVMLARPGQRGEGFLPALLGFPIGTQEAENVKEASSILSFVGLDQEANHLARDLSYGQQKLLSLACCIATGSSVFLLDEPVSGVHPELIQPILTLVRQLGETGRLVVFVEHNLGAVQQAADVVIAMDRGRIIAQGRPDTVLAMPEIADAYLS